MPNQRAWLLAILAALALPAFCGAASIQFQNPEKNPRTGRTTVNFQLGKLPGETVKIRIHDSRGKKVAELVRPGKTEAAFVSWDCTLAPSGNYTATVIRKGKPDKKIQIEVRH